MVDEAVLTPKIRQPITFIKERLRSAHPTSCTQLHPACARMRYPTLALISHA